MYLPTYPIIQTDKWSILRISCSMAAPTVSNTIEDDSKFEFKITPITSFDKPDVYQLKTIANFDWHTNEAITTNDF